MRTLTLAQSARLDANWKASRAAIAKDGDTPDHRPVVKLFDPCGGATWLLTECDYKTQIAFGLCDLGHGSPELGSVSMTELTAYYGRFTTGIERDRHWRAAGTLSQYAAAAREAGRIVEL